MKKSHNKEKLIELLGILLEPGKDKVKGNEKEMFEFARANKLPYFYLRRLSEITAISWVNDKLAEIEPKVRAFDKTLIDIGDALGSTGIEYVIFKTIKPFYALPNDVDVLIFDGINDLKEITSLIKDFGFNLLNIEEPYSVTAKSPSGYSVELYFEPSISYIIYLDKEELKIFLTNTPKSHLPYRTLANEGEIICVASHSVFKEQILTLADILEFSFRANDSSFDFNLMASVSHSCGVDLGLELAFKAARQVLSYTDFGWMCQGLQKAIDSVKELHPRSKPYMNEIQLGVAPPLKFPVVSLLTPFARLMVQSPKARISLLRQIAAFKEVKNYHTKMLGSLILSRIRRTTY